MFEARKASSAGLYVKSMAVQKTFQRDREREREREREGGRQRQTERKTGIENRN